MSAGHNAGLSSVARSSTARAPGPTRPAECQDLPARRLGVEPDQGSQARLSPNRAPASPGRAACRDWEWARRNSSCHRRRAASHNFLPFSIRFISSPPRGPRFQQVSGWGREKYRCLPPSRFRRPQCPSADRSGGMVQRWFCRSWACQGLFSAQTKVRATLAASWHRLN